MLQVLFEIFMIVLFIAVGGTLALAKTAIGAARRTRLQELSDGGSRSATLALELSKDPEQLRATLQVGINLVWILIGAYATAAIAPQLGVWLDHWPLVSPHGSVAAFIVVVGIVAFACVVIGELVPRRIALAHAETVAMAVSRPVAVLLTVSAPAVRVLHAATDAFMRLFPATKEESPAMTEEEVHIILEQSAEAGVIEPEEQEMAQRALRLGDRIVRSLMTPRPDVVWFELRDTPEKVFATIAEHGRAEYPVCQNSLDEIVGIVSAKDLWRLYYAKHPHPLEQSLRRDVLYAPGTMDVLRLLERFKESGQRLALVIDEFGGFDGLITLTDVVEAILGDLPSNEDDEQPEIIERDDGSYLVDGAVPIEMLNERLALTEALDSVEYDTVGGLVMTHLGRIPSASEAVEFQQLRFEVLDMDGKRVDKVLVTRLPAPTHDGSKPQE